MSALLFGSIAANVVLVVLLAVALRGWDSALNLGEHYHREYQASLELGAYWWNRWRTLARKSGRL